VFDCKDFELEALAAVRMESANKRFVAQRSCNSAQPSLILIDMAASSPSTIDIPQNLVLGMAFSPSSRRFALLTDQHEVWIYGMGQDVPRFEQKISLPGSPIPSDDSTCQRSQAISFVDENRIIGVDRGPFLFAVKADTSRVLWSSRTPGRMSVDLEQVNRIEATPNASYFAVSTGKAIQLFDIDTGMELTNAFEPLAELDNPPTKPRERHFDVIELGEDGGITVKCDEYNEDCAGRMFTRTAPSQPDPACPILELLVGQDETGQRLDSAALIRALKNTTCATEKTS
jgi:hypothetical protein